MKTTESALTEGLSIDVPNEDWLQDKIDYAKQKSPTHHGHPYMGATTAYVRPPIRVPMSTLKKLRGMRNEQDNVRKEDLIAIMRIMKDTGKLPLTDNGEEYVPFINVAYDGSAWINEGNHRIMAALALGWHDLPVEISYFDGGERIESGPMYPGKIGLGHTAESHIMEGGWASTETQNTVITPKTVAEIIHILDGFEASYNAWQANNGLDTEIKIGKPKGSGTYYRRDLEQDPNREYGDVDVECFIHSRAGVASAARITEYKSAITEYCFQSPDFSTENGTNIIMRTTDGAVQVDLIFTYHEHADWSRVLSPEYRVKGVISTSLTSSIAEALNLSFSSQGIQVKIRNNQPVSFRQSKNTELRTVSTSPETWAQDVYSLYYYLSHGQQPESMPRELQAHGGLKDEQRLSDIVLSIKALASGLEQADLLGHGALIDIPDKRDLIRRVAQIYSAKLEAAENSSKFDKASTPMAVEKAKKTKLMLAKYRNEVTKLLLN